VGTRYLDGVASNLEVNLNHRLDALNNDSDQTDVLAEGLALLLRQKMTNRPVSDRGREVLSHCSDTLQKVSPEWLEKLCAEQHDQQSFAQQVNDLLVAMNFVDGADAGEYAADANDEFDEQDLPEDDSDSDLPPHRVHLFRKLPVIQTRSIMSTQPSLMKSLHHWICVVRPSLADCVKDSMNMSVTCNRRSAALRIDCKDTCLHIKTAHGILIRKRVCLIPQG